MASYDEIKAEAIRIYSDKASPEPTKRMAGVAVALCDRLAELEERHRVDMHRLEMWVRNLRQ